MEERREKHDNPGEMPIRLRMFKGYTADLQLREKHKNFKMGVLSKSGTEKAWIGADSCFEGRDHAAKRARPGLLFASS